MKKRILSAVLAAALCAAPMSAVFAAEPREIVLRVGDEYMTVDGVNKEIDPGRGTAPIIADGRTLVPMRAVIEEMGGEIAWSEAAKMAQIKCGKTEIVLTIGNPIAMVRRIGEASYKRIAMDTEPTIINGRTFLPARFVMEQLKCSVQWDGDTQSVIIKNAYVSKYNDLNDITVATVDGINISLADFNYAYYSNASQYEEYYSYLGIDDWENEELDDTTVGEYVFETALNEVLQLAAVERLAPEYGVLAEGGLDMVQRMKETSVVANRGGREGYVDYLEANFTANAAVDRYLLRMVMLNDMYENAKNSTCAVSDDELAYNDDTYTKVKHVLIGSDNRTDEEAKAMAERVIAELNAGADMDELISKYNEDPGMDYSDYYVFTEGEMVDEFYTASRSLKIGEWSKQPVKSYYGYHVIYRYALDMTDDKAYEIRETTQQNKFISMLDEWVEAAEKTVDTDKIRAALAEQREARKN